MACTNICALCDEPTPLDGRNCVRCTLCRRRFHVACANHHTVNDTDCTGCREVLSDACKANDTVVLERLKQLYKPAIFRAGGQTIAICSGEPVVAIDNVSSTAGVSPPSPPVITPAAYDQASKKSSYKKLKHKYDQLAAENVELNSKIK